MSGHGKASPAPVLVLAFIASAVSAVDFMLVARGFAGPAVAMVLGILVIAWRAWGASRVFGPVLDGAGLDRKAAMARFRRVPVATAMVCLVLGLGVPMFAYWTGFEGSVHSLRGQRTIAYADAPALFWFTTACWFAVSATLVWGCALFAWSIERLRQDPRRIFEMQATAR